jgi:hypothetical protein
MPTQRHGDQSSEETWGFTPGVSYEDRIRTILFEAGTRRLEAIKDQEAAMAAIEEALRRGEDILSISEMSRLSGVRRQQIYRILGGGEAEGDPSDAEPH